MYSRPSPAYWMAIFLLLGVFAVAGCKKQAGQSAPPEVPIVSTEEETPRPTSPTPGTTEGAHPGKAIYEANNCSRCHMLNGKGGTEGPDLSKVGANPERTVEWLMQQIKNPKVHKPDSGMPSFETEIKEVDLRALAEYLASLK